MLGVTIVHELGHYKMRVHANEKGRKKILTPEKFLNFKYIEHSIFQGSFSQKPSDPSFSRIACVILGKIY
jgi:hypothetical protein